MAVLPRQMPETSSSLLPTPNRSPAQVYLLAILLAVFSLVFFLLIIPPMLWHFRNRNIGATVLVAWVAMLLLFTFVNAVLWPSDDIDSWFNGVGLCDIEVKIQVASQVGLPASLACVLRALAAVLDTDRATMMQSKAQRRRTYTIDLLWCIGFPLLQMLLHYVVQTRRYYLYGIAGCVPAVNDSLVTIFLLGVPPLIWTLIDAYYAVLILIRLYRYRVTFNSIVASSNTTRSRFMRLYIICIMWILGYIPVEVYTLYQNIDVLAKVPYRWRSVHNPESWNQIIMVPSGGTVVYDRWIWLTGGVVVFVFFGFGRDAINMYRTGLQAIGLHKIIPNLSSDHQASITATISSFNSRAKMIFKRKASTLSSIQTSESHTSHTTSSSEPISPKKMTFLDTIDESSSTQEKHSNSPNQSVRAPQDPEKAAQRKTKPSVFSRITSIFQSKKASQSFSRNPMQLADLTGQPTTVHSGVTSGPRSPSLMQHVSGLSDEEMVVRMEVRQGSEHERPLPTVTHGDTRTTR